MDAHTVIDSIWYKKHRPKTFDEYIFNNPQHKQAFGNIVERRNIPHLLLSGGPGTGKSAIVELLLDQCMDEDSRELDLLKLNASDSNSVDDVRSSIFSHITSSGMGQYKVVWLEEADYMSLQAQGILRDYMDHYEEHCRFILTCNHPHKIAPAIKSRCHQYQFTACDKFDALEMVAKILVKENIKVDLDTLQQHVDLHHPDLRSILNSVEQYSSTGTLVSPKANVSSKDVIANLSTMVERDQWDELRIQVTSGISDDQAEEVFEMLYQNLDKSKKFKSVDLWEQGIVLIADHLHKHITHAKPIINLASLIIQLKHLEN